jgi:hypothetical protein
MSLLMLFFPHLRSPHLKILFPVVEDHLFVKIELVQAAVQTSIGTKLLKPSQFRSLPQTDLLNNLSHYHAGLHSFPLFTVLLLPQPLLNLHLPIKVLKLLLFPGPALLTPWIGESFCLILSSKVLMYQ